MVIVSSIMYAFLKFFPSKNKTWNITILWLSQDVSVAETHVIRRLLFLCHMKPYLHVSLSLSHSKQNKESIKE